MYGSDGLVSYPANAAPKSPSSSAATGLYLIGVFKLRINLARPINQLRCSPNLLQLHRIAPCCFQVVLVAVYRLSVAVTMRGPPRDLPVAVTRTRFSPFRLRSSSRWLLLLMMLLLLRLVASVRSDLIK